MAKFCTKCGKPLPDDGSPCSECEVLEQTAAGESGVGKVVSQVIIGETGQFVKENTEMIKFDVADEDNATIRLGGTTVKIGMITKLIAIALCIMFFLPLVSLDVYGINVTTVSGWTLAFSLKSVDGNILVLLLFLIPIALFVLYQFKNRFDFLKGKLFLASTVLSALGILGLFVFAGNMDGFRMTLWYYLSFFLYIITGVLSVGSLMSTKKK